MIRILKFGGSSVGSAAALRRAAALGHEPVGGLLTGSSTVSVAFLVPETRLGDLIPRLHERCVLRSPEHP